MSNWCGTGKQRSTPKPSNTDALDDLRAALRASERVADDHEPCGNCRDGVYFIGGRVENGQFIGKTGICFQCVGKGYTTAEDRRRTRNYYRYYFRPTA